MDAGRQASPRRQGEHRTSIRAGSSSVSRMLSCPSGGGADENGRVPTRWPDCCAAFRGASASSRPPECCFCARRLPDLHSRDCAPSGSCRRYRSRTVSVSATNAGCRVCGHFAKSAAAAACSVDSVRVCGRSASPRYAAARFRAPTQLWSRHAHFSRAAGSWPQTEACCIRRGVSDRIQVCYGTAGTRSWCVC